MPKPTLTDWSGPMFTVAPARASSAEKLPAAPSSASNAALFPSDAIFVLSLVGCLVDIIASEGRQEHTSGYVVAFAAQHMA
jgi:hypothetical protein